jgi:hypothetical protein
MDFVPVHGIIAEVEIVIYLSFFIKQLIKVFLHRYRYQQRNRAFTHHPQINEELILMRPELDGKAVPSPSFIIVLIGDGPASPLESGDIAHNTHEKTNDHFTPGGIQPQGRAGKRCERTFMHVYRGSYHHSLPEKTVIAVLRMCVWINEQKTALSENSPLPDTHAILSICIYKIIHLHFALNPCTLLFITCANHRSKGDTDV